MDDIVLKEFDGSSEVMKKLTEAVEGELQFQYRIDERVNCIGQKNCSNICLFQYRLWI